MPLKSQYGFIYSGNIDTRTIAHELAHGAFRLWHTFSTESDFLLPQNTSDNLMDYNDGKRLHKYQWDYIHNPEGGLYLFQDEDEGAMVSYDNNKIIEVINKIKQNNLNSTEFYETTFTEDLNIIGKDINLGGNTYEYIKIVAPLTSNEEGKKEITTNIFDRESNVKIEIDGEEKNMVKFDFDVINYVYDGTNDVPSGMNDVPFDIFVLEEDADAFELYISQKTFAIDDVNEGITDALDDGEGFNPTSYACNICVRSSLHHIANDNVLFPFAVPSRLGAEGTPYYSGKISGVGKANNIYIETGRWLNNDIYINLSTYEDEIRQDDYQDWISDCKNNEACIENRQSARDDTLINTTHPINEFEYIPKDITITIDGEEYDVPDFNKLQSQANNGVLIIGVRRNTELEGGSYKSGHIVLISPYEEGSGDDDNRLSFVSTADIEILFPRTVECGGDRKKLGWLLKDFAKDMEWYRYK